jgi:hypothetical protein
MAEQQSTTFIENHINDILGGGIRNFAKAAEKQYNQVQLIVSGQIFKDPLGDSYMFPKYSLRHEGKPVMRLFKKGNPLIPEEPETEDQSSEVTIEEVLDVTFDIMEVGKMFMNTFPVLLRNFAEKHPDFPEDFECTPMEVNVLICTWDETDEYKRIPSPSMFIYKRGRNIRKVNMESDILAHVVVA